MSTSHNPTDGQIQSSSELKAKNLVEKAFQELFDRKLELLKSIHDQNALMFCDNYFDFVKILIKDFLACNDVEARVLLAEKYLQLNMIINASGFEGMRAKLQENGHSGNTPMQPEQARTLLVRQKQASPSVHSSKSSPVAAIAGFVGTPKAFSQKPAFELQRQPKLDQSLFNNSSSSPNSTPSKTKGILIKRGLSGYISRAKRVTISPVVTYSDEQKGVLAKTINDSQDQMEIEPLSMKKSEPSTVVIPKIAQMALAQSNEPSQSSITQQNQLIADSTKTTTTRPTYFTYQLDEDDGDEYDFSRIIFKDNDQDDNIVQNIESPCPIAEQSSEVAAIDKIQLYSLQDIYLILRDRTGLESKCHDHLRLKAEEAIIRTNICKTIWATRACESIEIYNCIMSDGSVELAVGHDTLLRLKSKYGPELDQLAIFTDFKEYKIMTVNSQTGMIKLWEKTHKSKIALKSGVSKPDKKELAEQALTHHMSALKNEPNRFRKFIALDVEAYEHNHQVILEIGFSIYRRENGSIESVHLIIEDNQQYRNGQYVVNNRESFAFGKSSIVPMSEAIKLLSKQLETADCLILHDSSADIRLLNDYIRLEDGDYSIVDLQELAELINPLHKKLSLEKILFYLNISYQQHLHNAGNDAYYTMQAFLEMSLRSKS